MVWVRAKVIMSIGWFMFLDMLGKHQLQPISFS